MELKSSLIEIRVYTATEMERRKNDRFQEMKEENWRALNIQ
jgi:chaperonin cofactor prefoldin